MMRRFTQKAFSDTEAAEYKPLRAFIESFFDDEHPIKTDKVSELKYIQHIAGALKRDKQYFSTSFHIERGVGIGGKKYFALFFYELKHQRV